LLLTSTNSPPSAIAVEKRTPFLKDRVKERRLGLGLGQSDDLNFAAEALCKASLKLGNLGDRVIAELDE